MTVKGGTRGRSGWAEGEGWQGEEAKSAVPLATTIVIKPYFRGLPFSLLVSTNPSPARLTATQPLSLPRHGRPVPLRISVDENNRLSSGSNRSTFLCRHTPLYHCRTHEHRVVRACDELQTPPGPISKETTKLQWNRSHPLVIHIHA